MLYLNKHDLELIGISWNKVIDVIEQSVRIVHDGDFVQPIKPYLRYHTQTNRIIAMPAYLGGKVSLAGLKWIASFPDNLKKGIPRAHSITILNDADTGVPVCSINSALISAIRTASVSGLVVREYLKAVIITKPLKIGIVGFGPIGRLHLDMLMSVLRYQIDRISLYDLTEIEKTDLTDTIVIAESWEECYLDADIFITCTVSDQRYINLPPKAGSLHLNVSLRDYHPDFRAHANFIVVDEWEEVCRQNTDIEVMHKTNGLEKQDTYSLTDVVCAGAFKNLKPQDVVMFNPMGMAVFDIAIGGYYYSEAVDQKVGTLLQD